MAHDRQLYREFLARRPEHSSIMVEAAVPIVGWQIRWSGLATVRRKLCNPLEAKRRIGLTKKTGTLDARGLAGRATLDRQPSLFTNIYNLPLTHRDSSLRLSL